MKHVGKRGRCLAIGLAGMMTSGLASATEGASSIYPLGTESLGAGLVAPAGWYVTTAANSYDGSVNGSVQGGVTVAEVRKQVDSIGVGLTYAPKATVLGGRMMFTLAAPYAHVRLKGRLEGATDLTRAVSGSTWGDVALTSRIGWKASPRFFHAITVKVWAPSGEYRKGFQAVAGHNRWTGDVAWSYTWLPEGNLWDLSGAIGYGVSQPNSATHYHSGNITHLELAVGRRFATHWVVGLGGYYLRQVEADRGVGARLGGLNGQVMGLGPLLTYAARVGGHALALSAGYHKEFNAHRHFEGDSFNLAATLEF